MQFLSVSESTKLSDLNSILGDYMDQFLHLNGIERTPNVGKAFYQSCHEAIAAAGDVSYERRATLLNGFVSDSDLFEQVALMDDNGWKLLDSKNVIPGSMLVPEGVDIADSTEVSGNGVQVDSITYNKAIGYLNNHENIDPGIFNSYNTVLANTRNSTLYSEDKTSATASPLDTIYAGSPSSKDTFQWFHIPWGEVTIHFSLDDTSYDFPVYPVELSDGARANYTTMPDRLYQYEPWQVYNSSGPRSIKFNFHFHRDMWSGDHRDGKAYALIQACKAACYPDYKGSAVNTTMATMYIAGNEVINGIVTDVSVDWSGPIGIDGWWLECNLGISITEVAVTPLNYNWVKQQRILN